MRVSRTYLLLGTIQGSEGTENNKIENNEEGLSEYNYYISLLLRHTFSYFTIFE